MFPPSERLFFQFTILKNVLNWNSIRIRALPYYTFSFQAEFSSLKYSFPAFYQIS